MRYALRLACGLAGATLLLLAGASAAFAADPVVTIDGSGGTSSNGSAVADTGTSDATATFGGNAPTTTDGGTDGTATATFGGNAPTTTDGGTDGTAAATFGGSAPSSTGDGTDGNATVTLGGLSAAGSGGAPGGAPGSDGSGGEAAAGSGGQGAGGAGVGNLPETSTEALAGARSAGFPILAIVMSLLAGWLVARRGSVSSAR